MLDPACGSGNFLYVSLNLLKELEKEVVILAAKCGHSLMRFVDPQQLFGIEINPYAAELARLVVWIGHIQWDKNNGLYRCEVPILTPLKNIQQKDAILDLSSGVPAEPKWPECEVIVGNPPFLGGKKMRDELGNEFLDSLFQLYQDRVPHEADLCCYWFERARKHIDDDKCKRAGLLATQGIRGGASREALLRIKETGDIFFAVSDKDWVLDGANVHISIIGFDNGMETQRIFDEKPVQNINANLTIATADLTKSRHLKDNLKIGFMGTTKVGPFDIDEQLALKWCREPNPNGKPNSDVLLPWMNGMDITRRPSRKWIIYFGRGTKQEACSFYEAPFEYLEKSISVGRKGKGKTWYRDAWWELYAPRPELYAAINLRCRFIATARVSKFRLFVWLEKYVVPDCQLIVFARDDDFFFGVLHSRLHEVWALKLGTRLETRPRYTPTTCFETFPLPQATPKQEQAIAAAAKELDTLRNNWLNPPEWTREDVLTFPGSVAGPWARYVTKPDKAGIGTVRYPRLLPADADCAKRLAKRTLTNLYNERPAWLDLAHKKLDEAVSAAYGWPADLSDEQILEKLLSLNLERAKGNAGREKPRNDD
ncbi:MAG TPA: DNA methyltransferase [Planctomycetota bacterium]|nr:DNA methyltransferase [Planctomycetota bacterium]